MQDWTSDTLFPANLIFIAASCRSREAKKSKFDPMWKFWGSFHWLPFINQWEISHVSANLLCALLCKMSKKQSWPSSTRRPVALHYILGHGRRLFQCFIIALISSRQTRVVVTGYHNKHTPSKSQAVQNSDEPEYAVSEKKKIINLLTQILCRHLTL